jgi:tetratricopeptide (TPR) repeat protein
VSRHVAFIDRLSGRLDDAARGYEQALAIFTETDDKIAIACVLHGLAQVKLELREVDSAKELLSDALQLTQIAQCGRIEAQVQHRMGEANLLTGNLAEAVSAFELALARTSAVGDYIGEAYALMGAGVAKVRLGESVRLTTRCSVRWSWPAVLGSRWQRQERCLG